MSRVSGKSSLSPTSGGINLQKNGDIDLGKKTQPSVSSGGIGITQEVGQVGGMSVTGGVSVDVSPLELDISATVDASDPSKNSISIAGSAEFPGGLIGLGGGVKINTSTGAIQGGSISGELGGFGVEVGADSEEGLSLTLSYQIPFTPVVISIGFGEKKEKKEPTKPPLKPSPAAGQEVSASHLFGCEALQYATQKMYDFNGNYLPGSSYENRLVSRESIYKSAYWWSEGVQEEESLIAQGYLYNSPSSGYRIGDQTKRIRGTGEKVFTTIRESGSFRTVNEGESFEYRRSAVAMLTDNYEESVAAVESAVRKAQWTLTLHVIRRIEIVCPLDHPSNNLDPDNLPPPPNLPPRKEMDECCRLSIRLLRLLYKGLGISKFPGNLPSTIIQKVENGSLPEPPPKPIADWVDLFM
jgi:hypothetical protein